MKLRKICCADYIGKLGLLGKIVGQTHDFLFYMYTSHQYGFTKIRIDQKHGLTALCKGSCKVESNITFSLIRCTACKCNDLLIGTAELNIVRSAL